MSPTGSSGRDAEATASSGVRRTMPVLMALGSIVIIASASVLGFWLGFSQVTRTQLGGGILQSRLMACDGSVSILQAVRSMEQLAEPAAASSQAQACLNSLDAMMPYLSGQERLAAERQIAKLQSLLVSRTLVLHE